MNIFKHYLCLMALFMMSTASLMAAQISPALSVCDYFPSAAQTWSNSGKLSISGSAIIENAHQGKYVGFVSNKINATSTSCADTQGNNITKCLSNTRLMIPEYPWEESPPWLSPITPPAHKIQNGDMILSPGEYLSLPYDSRHTTGKYIFTAGTYWVQHTTFAGNETLEFPNDKVELNVDSFSISGNTIINTSGDPDNLVLIAHTLNGMISLSSNNLFNALIVSRNSVSLSGNVEVRGAVATKVLTMSGYAKIIAQSDCFNPIEELKLFISPTTGKGIACDGIAIDFSLVDSNNQVVVGKGQELVVTSSPLSGKKNACWSDNGEITTPECNHVSDSAFSVNFPVGSPAVVRRYIHSKFLNSYNIDASVASESLNLPAGPYEFVAESVSIVPSEGVDGSDSYQVAGRPFPFRLKLRGKENGNGNQLNCKVIEETRDVTVNFSHAKQPASSSEALLISVDSGQSWQAANRNIEVSFIDGIAGGDINNANGGLLAKFSDAGIVDMTIKDTDQTKSISATHRFYFRPFTATVCDQSGALPAFTDEVPGAYLPSGTNFSGYLKAVNWISLLDSNGYGDGIPDRSDTSLVCSKNATPSYVTHNGFIAELSLMNETYYPINGDNGILTADGVEANTFKKEVTDANQYQATVFNWNDVGTLSMDAFQYNYLGRSQFNIPSTKALIGRFYPAYFSITDTLWQSPTNQGAVTDGFTYMGQPFKNVYFEVTSYSKRGNTPTNYGFFDPSIKANFILSGDYKDRVNITNTDLDETHWKGGKWHTPNSSSVNWENTIVWEREGATSPSNIQITTADGPFNEGSSAITTELGLTISGVDPVTFVDTESVVNATLLEQPAVRYGRMALDSVGTAVGQSVNVPMRVEFWDGDKFVISERDDNAHFNGLLYCKQTVWPDPTALSKSQLSGSGVSKNGMNTSDLDAIADSDNASLREQVRFWLRLHSVSPHISESGVNCTTAPTPSTSQSWLQYNWRGKGDEDPSSVITFGIYRGNDRVIFRGESNIIGTSN